MIKNFSRTEFFPIKQKLDLNNLIKDFDDFIVDSKIKKNFEIKDVSSLDFFRKSSLVFISSDSHIKNLQSDDLCIITNKKSNFNFDYNNVILVNDLSESYNSIINHLFYHEDDISFSDDFIFTNGSHISKYAKISDNAKIGKNCVIGRGVEIGNNSIIKHNVVIKNSILGSNVVISDNTSIGTTGFGFDFKKRGAVFLNPQIGIVYIDNNSHIGSSCTIDRGKIDITYIGKNCMIDNLVHLAHNVILSDNACIAAQTGISGSVFIGPNVTVGGQSGFSGHIKIGRNVTIAAKSGVTKNLDDYSTVAGFPATDIKVWKKNIINERKNRYK